MSGVDFFSLRTSLQNLRWSVSRVFRLRYPQISHPYNIIGKTVLSKSSNWMSMGRFPFLDFLITLNIALLPCFFNSLILFTKEPLLAKVTPRYLKFLTTSMGLSPILKL